MSESFSKDLSEASLFFVRNFAKILMKGSSIESEEGKNRLVIDLRHIPLKIANQSNIVLVELKFIDLHFFHL
jgi:hypothetical protein